MVFRMLAVLAEFERDQVAERTSVIKESGSAGRFPMGTIWQEMERIWCPILRSKAACNSYNDFRLRAWAAAELPHS